MPYRFAYIVFAGLRFIPLMQYEGETIREARMIRGVSLQRGSGVLATARSLASIPSRWQTLLVTLIANGLRHVPASAVALEVRGFGTYRRRTFFREYHVDRRGPVFATAWLVMRLVYLLLTGTSLLKSVQSTL